jgi:hypothetical protein
VGDTQQITIYGSGFDGKPSITSNEFGTKARVTKNKHYGNELVVQVSVQAGSREGRQTFEVTNHDHNSCDVHYWDK